MLFAIGAVLGLVLLVVLWRRHPAKRRHLVIGALLAAGGVAFGAWWVLFRIDDPTFAADRDHALETQKALDDALGKDF